YMFEGPIEARWRHVDNLDSVVELAPRLRLGFLISDLVTLGSRPPETPAAPFVGIEQALGWMYAVERGRRMNRLVHRHLRRRIPQVLTIAGNYLLASSPCGVRWQQLGTALDRFAHNSVIADQIINAALRAFRSMRVPPRPAARAA